MLDRFFVWIELLADVTVRSSSLMEYPRFWRRVILVTFPLAVILLALVAALASFVVYLASLIGSLVGEEASDLWNAPSVMEMVNRR